MQVRRLRRGPALRGPRTRMFSPGATLSVRFTALQERGSAGLGAPGRVPDPGCVFGLPQGTVELRTRTRRPQRSPGDRGRDGHAAFSSAASRAHSRTRRRGAGTHAPSASGLARADCENAPGRTSLTSVHGHLGPCPHLCKTPGGRASWEGSCGIVFKIRVFGAFLQNGSPKSRSEQ